MYAVAILTLVAMAGIGFDYGRMVALDTELQNAADQAALAAATQLDGGFDAMERAKNAALYAFADSDSPFVNETRFAIDESGRPITELTFQFYESHTSDPDALVDEVPDGGDQSLAKVVQVTVKARKIKYALTPLIGALNDQAIGRAAATLESATCNVPPLMFCVPEVDGVADRTFPTSADIGRALHLHIKNTNGSYVWAPGNFGFLDIDYGLNGSVVNRSLGLNSKFLGCTGEAIETEPGNKDPQADALNSRMDFYSGSVNANDCNGDGDFCPSNSVRKNLVVTETKVVRQASGTPATPACGDYDTRSSGWTANASVNNFMEDTCLITGTCAVLGDGVWDYTTYFNTRHTANAAYPVPTAADFGKSGMDEVTRYDVYKWELEDPATRLLAERISTSMTGPTGSGANRRFTFTNVCAYPYPIFGTGVAASSTQKDRRVLTVAAVDCTGLNGKAEVDILRWVDIFVLEQVPNTGSDKDFRTEIVGLAELAGGGSGFQYYGRRKAVLIR